MRLQLSALSLAVATAWAPAVASADSPWRIAADTLVYSDDDNVDVVSPQLSVSRDIDERGGQVGTRVVVDYISAASVDVISQATTRFEEIRTEVDLSASMYLAGMLPSLGFRYSHEADYVSQGIRLGTERRVGSADTTVSGGYGLTLDAVGMSGTPSSAFSERLMTHSADIGVTQVLGRRSVARLVYSLTVQSGYMEKPYRLVPLFDAAGIAAAEADGVELGLDTFDAYRLAGKPPEEVPDERVRHAFALRALHYVEAIDSSLRLDYQFYVDSWGIMAHTVEPGLYIQLPGSLRLGAFGRGYVQSSASFWQRAYTVSGEGVEPRWRTIDRHLSAFSTLAGGARVEWDIGSVAAYVEGTAMLTRFDDYLLLDERFAVVGQAGMRWTP